MNVTKIHLGETTAAEAAEAIKARLAQPAPIDIEGIYAALRSWVWTALTEARRDDELRDWFTVLKRTAVAIERDSPVRSHCVRALHELLQQSIAVAAELPVEEVVARKHVARLLAMLAEARGGMMERGELKDRLDLGQPNLTRLLNMLAAVALVKRRKAGHKVVVQLTELGQAKAADLRAAEGAEPGCDARAHVLPGTYRFKGPMAVEKKGRPHPVIGRPSVRPHRRGRRPFKEPLVRSVPPQGASDAG